MHVDFCTCGLFQCRKAANMIGMSVRQQDMTNVTGLFAQLANSLEYLFCAAGSARVRGR